MTYFFATKNEIKEKIEKLLALKLKLKKEQEQEKQVQEVFTLIENFIKEDYV